MTMSKAEAARHKSQHDQILRLREDVEDARQQRDGYALKVKTLEGDIKVIVGELEASRKLHMEAELQLARAWGWIDCTMKVPPGGKIKSDIDFDDLCKEAIR
jgi:hypothetical protein